MKNNHDYDNTFKSLKNRHKRLFISVINEAFHKNYPLDSKVDIVSSEGAFIDHAKPDDKTKVESRENDFLLRIEDDYYLIEAQSSDDNTMALRLAEYTFLAARSVADYSQEAITMRMPNYTVIYIKNSKNTPRTTNIIFKFPDGSEHEYIAENIFMSDFTREAIIEKKLYVLIPFYFARYEKELSSGKNIERVIDDLEYFNRQLIQLHTQNELDIIEADEISHCVNDVLLHMTDGNNVEGRVVSVMGGEIYELHTERLIRETTEKVTAEVTADVTEKVTAEFQEQIAEDKERIAALEAEIAELKKNNKPA